MSTDSKSFTHAVKLHDKDSSFTLKQIQVRCILLCTIHYQCRGTRKAHLYFKPYLKLLIQIQFSWQKSVNEQQKKLVLFSACFSKCRSAVEVLWSFPLCNQTQSFVFDVDQISSLLNPGSSLSLHTKWRDLICPSPDLFSRTTVNSSPPWQWTWSPLVSITRRAGILLLFGATESGAFMSDLCHINPSHLKREEEKSISNIWKLLHCA